MSVYSKKGKGWRYDFTLNQQRYSQAWFKTKTAAKQAEADRRKKVKERQRGPQTPTDMGFLELVNRRLDHVKAYNSDKHYTDYRYLARKWSKRWGTLKCNEITAEMIQKYVLRRSKVSTCTANKELRSLRSLFNFGKRWRLVRENATDGIQFLPEERKIKYVPPTDDIEKVIAAADADTRDYLWTIRETMTRVSEVNRLSWDDIDLDDQYVVLYTRKKKGGHLTPRKVPMTQKLFDVLSRRHLQRDRGKPWVFWHTYWSSKTGEKCEGPYDRRKKLMKSLCKKAGVRYFNFHALRHSGASIMDGANVPLGAIQRILGHEQRTTTKIYLHSLDQSEREAMLVYEQSRSKSHTESHTRCD